MHSPFLWSDVVLDIFASFDIRSTGQAHKYQASSRAADVPGTPAVELTLVASPAQVQAERRISVSDDTPTSVVIHGDADADAQGQGQLLRPVPEDSTATTALVAGAANAAPV